MLHNYDYQNDIFSTSTQLYSIVTEALDCVAMFPMKDQCGFGGNEWCRVVVGIMTQ